MVAVNNLLGSGKAFVDNSKKEKAHDFQRLWMYNKFTGEGKIIETQREFDKLEEGKFVDHPNKCEIEDVEYSPVEETVIKNSFNSANIKGLFTKK
jgi:hypothetical protein